MERKVTIQDVATLAGVSKSTVSRYLNAGYISDEKASRIRSAIQTTGFRSNFFARRLKTRDSKLIGIIVPRFDSYTGGRVLSGMGKAMEKAGYQALLQVSHLSSRYELERMRRLRDQGIDGLIVISVGITEDHIKLLEDFDLPVIFVGQQHPEVCYFKVDDYAAGRVMGKTIRELGHKRVVFAGVTSSDRAVGIERRDGFEEVFSRGNRGASVTFVETGFDFQSAYNAGAEIMSYCPTAIVGATDNIGLGVLRYLHERGISVPEEVSVTGFGGYDVAALSYPPLTTIAFDYEGLGTMAVENMLKMLDGEDVVSKDDVLMQVVVRGSVRKAINRK
ncbi:LacI family DNA-binding transcriptional regulator [Selenomonas sp. TAMA-11512]|uniref:LacI family DNA-binding transcriptional regulator n=1 Tax=Selenomonas sp. TAMA-11512 TaxID=3095337 RepID=UPI00308EDCB1|nr:LacI family DNA-binding transcriptional regulator [Selenomonas sp. TAMA-11512]